MVQSRMNGLRGRFLFGGKVLGAATISDILYLFGQDKCIFTFIIFILREKSGIIKSDV